MVALEEYESLRQRPPGKPAMHQRWRDLLFLHVTADPEAVQALLPPGLTVDTYPVEGEERAWIGLVPFRMEGVRPYGVPSTPWLSAFPETNVRTYVHREGKQPGVWFFSLDAARWIACRIARRTFNLPYYHSRMMTLRNDDRVSYWSSRKEQPGPGELAATAVLGEPMPQPEPGSLEFFLVERYLLYAERAGKLFTGQVWHVPYPLREAKVADLQQTLVQLCGLEWENLEHVCFSEGVDVEVFPLRPVGP